MEEHLWLCRDQYKLQLWAERSGLPSNGMPRLLADCLDMCTWPEGCFGEQPSCGEW